MIRWKLEVQEFDFNLEYIPGPENMEADMLSRMDYNSALTVGVISSNPVDVSPVAKWTLQKNGQWTKSQARAGAATTAKPCGYQQEITLLAAQHDEVQHQHHPHRVRPLAQDPPLDVWVHKAIAECHNAKVGHGGVNRTLKKIYDNKVSKVTRRHVEQFCRQCPECQLMSQVKHVVHTHPFTTAAYAPMERIAVDSIGPFEADCDGNTHIMVVIDCFTRYAELYAIQKLMMRSA